MGDPRVAKTTVTNLLATIYAELGFLSDGKVIKAYREDFIGQYLGETAEQEYSAVLYKKQYG